MAWRCLGEFFGTAQAIGEPAEQFIMFWRPIWILSWWGEWCFRFVTMHFLGFHTTFPRHFLEAFSTVSLNCSHRFREVEPENAQNLLYFLTRTFFDALMPCVVPWFHGRRMLSSKNCYSKWARDHLGRWPPERCYPAIPRNPWHLAISRLALELEPRKRWWVTFECPDSVA